MEGGTWFRCCWLLAALGGVLCCPVAMAQETSIGVSPEFTVGSWVVAPQVLAGSSPAVAFDGQQYLVVWVSQTAAHAVLATRVRADGTVLDAPALIVGYDAGDSFIPTAPAVAFDGQRFVVAWSTTTGVKVTQVETNGTVPHPEGRYLEQGWDRHPAGSPAIACADGQCLIAWTRASSYDTSMRLVAQRLRSDLTSPDAAPFLVAVLGAEPSVSAAHGVYLIAWKQFFELSEPQVRARLVPRESPVSPGDGFFLTSGGEGQRAPHVSAFDEGWLAVWARRDESGQRIVGSRVSLTGAVLDMNGVPLSSANGAHDLPRATFNGGRWLLTWSEGDSSGESWRLGAAWVATNLSTSALSGVLAPEPRYPRFGAADVAAGPGGALVVWSSGHTRPPSQGFAVFGTRVGADGAARDTPALELSSTAGTQERPAVARGGSEELLVWAETRTLAGSTILGARIGVDGRRVGAEVVLPSAPGSRHPAVAWDGGRYLVVWEELAPDGSTDIRGARVSATGKVLDAVSLAISTAPGKQRAPAVTFAAGRWWVVWEDTRNASWPDFADIYGTRVRYFGEVVDPGGLRLSSDPVTQSAPAVTFLGDDVLVVWEAKESWGVSMLDIRGTRVRWNGEVKDPADLAIATHFSSQVAPAVASDGTRALVVWEDYRLLDGRRQPKIFGARVEASGLVRELEGLPIGDTTARLREAATVTFDGLHFWVAWESRPANSDSFDTFRVDVRGARVTVDGQVDVAEVGLSTRADAELGPVLSSDGQGRARVYYRRFVPQPAAGTERIKGRFILETQAAGR